jgi:hypothetical protein
MDPTLIVVQFFQNEIGHFRAAFELTTEDDDELIRRVPSSALGRGWVIRPAALGESSRVTQSFDTI